MHIKKQQNKGGPSSASSSSGTTSAQLQSQMAQLQHNILQQQQNQDSSHSLGPNQSPHLSSTPSHVTEHEGTVHDHRNRDKDIGGASPVSETSARSTW